MMVGDGLNDILSLEEACLGVSINAKSEINLIASDVLILDENLWRIVYLFKLVKISSIFIYINLFWAFSYNFFMIPLAAGCFEGLGIIVSPLFSTTAMSLSSLLVVLFSTLIKFINIEKININKPTDYHNAIDLTHSVILKETTNENISIIHSDN